MLGAMSSILGILTVPLKTNRANRVWDLRINCFPYIISFPSTKPTSSVFMALRLVITQNWLILSCFFAFFSWDDILYLITHTHIHIPTWKEISFPKRDCRVQNVSFLGSTSSLPWVLVFLPGLKAPQMCFTVKLNGIPTRCFKGEISKCSLKSLHYIFFWYVDYPKRMQTKANIYTNMARGIWNFLG